MNTIFTPHFLFNDLTLKINCVGELIMIQWNIKHFFLYHVLNLHTYYNNRCKTKAVLMNHKMIEYKNHVVFHNLWFEFYWCLYEKILSSVNLPGAKVMISLSLLQKSHIHLHIICALYLNSSATNTIYTSLNTVVWIKLYGLLCNAPCCILVNNILWILRYVISFLFIFLILILVIITI